MTSRRSLLKALTLSPIALAGSAAVASPVRKANAKIQFSLNTSTLRGQKLNLTQMIEVASKSGYDGIELWISELDSYLSSGKSLASLKKLFSDAGIEAFNAIGFATWMAQDPAKSKAGFAQMEKEMNMLAQIGCKRIAAPAIGATAPVDLLEAGEKYAALLELGRKTGVMPQLEFWGAYKPFHHMGQALAVAAAANDADARLLPDVYHLFRGGSDFNCLDLVAGEAIEVMHLNDFSDDLPREQQEDKHRIYPGDGVAPLDQISKRLKEMGGTKILSLELFNETYYAQEAELVAKTGLSKMKQFF
ncbi:sugar phosphate isomerase/epimerase [Algoriphagus halophytocola]|uniref:Sugar phosphate isomerase/epimerase n=1 Tax=Algoriphagus halophytocola TaxID=2991499 RepID=A0ABY6MEF8_9BACT|nr:MULTISPECIES: sugar phosphate isomerase/epimerase [unclassified Algoriphagus]UZD22157.1 sugar phosphate isomerase/epimerase [Algoriphagus sp. TR-M5]WBL43408.1 sugar phosphate isomerase/epimerase [Algoriphagus sp. TR-M9]